MKFILNMLIFAIHVLASINIAAFTPDSLDLFFKPITYKFSKEISTNNQNILVKDILDIFEAKKL